VLQESNLLPFIEKLSMWKKYLEHVFSSRPRKQAMEQSSSYLVEFEHRRFEDVDLPGQFLLLRDTPNEFIRIERFVPEIEFIQDTNGCSRRITIIGHNGIAYPFLIQYPTPKSARVEERMRQLFSLMNSILDKEKATRGRKLNFYIPNIIPLSYQVRMIQDDARYQSLYSIYEEWCYDKKVNPDEPVHLYFGQLRQALKSSVTACIPPMW
jgi:transformation/transcription domain-associated protein